MDESSLYMLSFSKNGQISHADSEYVALCCVASCNILTVTD